MEQQASREPLEVFMERLPNRVLINFTRKHRQRFGLKIHLPRRELISQILQKVPKDIILQDLYAPYGWAGNVTIHLFQITGSDLNKISNALWLNS